MAQANELIDGVPVPGGIGLRGRFMLLVDPQGIYPAGAFELEWDTWKRQIELVDAADAGLVAHDKKAVAAAAEGLMATHRTGLHPLPIVDSLVALGDLARQEDEPAKAIVLLDEARKTAAAGGYRFGYMRATLSLGYVTVQTGSADDALLLFDEAEELAADLDDRVLRGGALVGKGEAHDRAGRLDDAITALDDAVALFDSIGSAGGVVNARLQLGDIYRRQHRNTEARTAFQSAFDLAERHGPWVAAVNALDGLGEIDLSDGDIGGALDHYRDAYERCVARDYPRGIGHAANGLGRVMYATGDLFAAIHMHTQARDAFRLVDDHLSQASALTGIADAHEAAANLEGAMNARLDAVEQIEVVRAAQDRHRPQQEFVERFRAKYRAALETAHKAQDVSGFVSVFEGLSGRRLAGLLGDVAVETPVLEAQMLAFAQTRNGHAETDRARKIARLLGRTALRAHLPSLVSDGIDDVAAALYIGFDRTSAPGLVDALGASTLFAPTLLPGTTDQMIALCHQRGGPPAIHRWTLPQPTAALVSDLASKGLDPWAALADVEPLVQLLPPDWEPPPGDLLIVPLEELWAVPWPAVTRRDGRLLGETHPLVVAPSMTLAASPATRPSGRAKIAMWRSRQVAVVDIQAFTGNPPVELTVIAEPAAAKTQLLVGDCDLLVIVAHGRPSPGIRHVLDLDDDVFVTPVDLMTAKVPARVALISCWGAHTPAPPGGEPLTLATLAAARGAEVLATTSELADDRLANRFINNILHDAAANDFPDAVHNATIDYLADPARRAGLLSRWAPIVTVGRQRSGDG